MTTTDGGILPVVETLPRAAGEPNYSALGRMSFSRYLLLTDQQYGCDGEMFSDILPTHLEHASPRLLFGSLVGRQVAINKGGRGHQAVGFKQQNGRGSAVALSAQEFSLVSGLSRVYGNSAHVRTTQAQLRKTPSLQDSDAPRRSIGHTLWPKISAVDNYAATTLAEQNRILGQFVEGTEGRKAGLARMGTEGHLRIRAALLFTQIIPDAMDAIADQRLWTPEQKMLAARSVVASMVHFREKNRHISYTNQLCRMLQDYNLCKQKAMRQRIETAQEYLRENSLEITPN